MRTGHVAAVRPRKELVTFQLIELHSVPRQLGPDCRLPKLAGSTAGGEMILQPCQPLVPNPLTARRSTTAALAAPYPIVMTPMRRVRLWPASDQACRALRGTSRRPEREDRGPPSACPDRARAAPCSSPRAIPRTLPVAPSQPRAHARNALPHSPHSAFATAA